MCTRQDYIPELWRDKDYFHPGRQLSVMMRQAGLTVPSIYGPNKEETAEFMKKMQSQPAAG